MAPANMVSENKTLGNKVWHTHFDIGFAVNSVPRSKKVMGRKGGRSEDLKVFEQLFGASLQLLCISRFTEYPDRLRISRFTEYLADRLCISRFTEYLADKERTGLGG